MNKPKYSPAKLEADALKLIETKNLFFLSDIIAYLPCSRATFYELKLDKSDSIKEALEKNRVNTKNSLRRKWHDNDSATTQVALYKLIADEDERKKLSQQYHDVTSDGEKLSPVTNVFTGMSEDQLDALGAELSAIVNNRQQSTSERDSE